jgi:thiamine biosynthesis lipoprotein
LKSIINTLGAVAVLAGLAAAAPEPLAARREYLMGTFAEIRVLDAPSPAVARDGVEAALAELRTVDRLMSAQRPDSDLSRVNRDAVGHPVTVDVRLLDVLETSLALHQATDGAFDVTVLPLAEAWGFTAGMPRRPALAPPLPVGPGAIRLDRAARTVAFGDPATRIDLGGVAKGWALDRAREILRARGIRSALLDLGGEVATLGGPPDGPPWRIAIRHPRRRGALLGVVEVGDGDAVSTSGDAEQYVVEAGVRLGHVFDPRTGRPATALVAATVVAASAAIADALSTAAVVLGEAGARRVLPRLHATGVFAASDGADGLRVTTTAGVRFVPDTRVAVAGNDHGS